MWQQCCNILELYDCIISRDSGRNHLIFSQGLFSSAVPISTLDGTAKLYVNLNIFPFLFIIICICVKEICLIVNLKQLVRLFGFS